MTIKDTSEAFNYNVSRLRIAKRGLWHCLSLAAWPFSGEESLRFSEPFERGFFPTPKWHSCICEIRVQPGITQPGLHLASCPIA